VEKRETGQGEHMARGKKYQPEQVVNLLRQIEVAVANGKSTEHACRDTPSRSDHFMSSTMRAKNIRWRSSRGF